ncbi:origin recognition complex subunit 1 isoform X2 [Polypterus senegalus]|uniref:origin recognition complex subunit 1 isoform X2 n=1 Tax=Polypterus senegalus TaxID=55291 RepID=UPI001962D923|nr:origin recognition complex subunit 1 isoform X2 [Polypterus senegalus]
MSRYFTRLKKQRHYSWFGKDSLIDRKLQVAVYEGLCVKSEDSNTIVRTGDFILIEGDHEENPYVARLLKLYDDGSGSSGKRAEVQWFVRIGEIPFSKHKLLGREPYAQEVFFYNIKNCDSDIDAETIICTAQVIHLSPETPFPVAERKGNTLYAKFSWDGKKFKALPVDVFLKGVSCIRGDKTLESPGKVPLERHQAVSIQEVESRHSASKNSHSKDPSARKTPNRSSTPGARKKLQLSSPVKSPKLTGKEVLKELFNADGVFISLESKNSKLTRTNSVASASPTKANENGFNLDTMESSPVGKKRAIQPTSRHCLIPLNEDTPAKKIRKNTNDQELSEDLLGISPLNGDVLEVCFRTRASQKIAEKEAAPRRKEKKDNSGEDRRTRSSRNDKKNFDNSKKSRSSDEDDLECETKERRSSSSPSKTLRSSRKSSAQKSSTTPNKTPIPRTPQGSYCATPSRSARSQASRKLRSLSEETRAWNFLNNMKLQQEMENSDGEDNPYIPEKDVPSTDEEEELDTEIRSRSSHSAVPRTPSSARKLSVQTSAKKSIKTPSKTSASKTPRTPRHATPNIPTRSQPARKPSNVLEEARARLHVSSVPESLPCREQEFQDIYSFVESKIIDGTGGCMYISGVPGTGKTATVHEVIRCLQHAADQDEIPPFNFIEINGMKMTDPHQAYVQILQMLTGQKATADHAATLLEKRFNTSAPKRETTVLLVDELDLLWTRKQNVMYNLFDWPTRKTAKLVVLAIANTMDLPERIMINRVASRLGLTRMSFQPYTYKQLQQIIMSRLNQIKAFEDDALQLVSRKVAALSGDARRCLDICRRSTDICELSSSYKAGTSLVGMSHVMEALDEMFSSPYITAIRCASLHEQLFLKATIAEFRRLGLEEASFQQVFQQHLALCRVEGVKPLCMSEGLAVCQRLGACRLLLIENSKNDLHLRVRLNVSQDDVLYALKEE